MPIYEYQCLACSYEFEALQSVSEAPIIDCPGCNQPQLRLKLTAAAFKLKGTGWYETDFKNNDKKNESGNDQKKKDSDKPKADSESKKNEKSKSDDKSSKSKASSTTSTSSTAA